MAKAKLGTILDQVSGGARSVIFVETAHGTVVRSRAKPRDPQTPAQLERRILWGRAMEWFSRLTPDEYAQWQDYAATTLHRDPFTGRRTYPAAHNFYLSLTRAFLAINSHSTPPTLPPAERFDGDDITITVTAGEGTLTFTADAPNAPNVTTELLIQPLKTAFRTPLKAGYRHQLYHAFTPDMLSITVPFKAGWCAPAIRFFHTETGQAARFQFFGKSEVV
jgi:hypothetical protein